MHDQAQVLLAEVYTASIDRRIISISLHLLCTLVAYGCLKLV